MDKIDLCPVAEVFWLNPKDAKGQGQPILLVCVPQGVIRLVQLYGVWVIDQLLVAIILGEYLKNLVFPHEEK